MSATTQQAATPPSVPGSWCEALFAAALRRYGKQGCCGQMAQEFGDHPETAAQRMRWVRQLAA